MTRRWRCSVGEVVQLPLELSHRAELVVLAREANVRHMIHRAQFVGNPLADCSAGYLALELPVHFLFHLADDAFLLTRRHGSLATRCHDAAHDVLWVEDDPRPITLHHHQSLCAFHALISGEPLAARKAFATASDRIARITRATVDHLVLIAIAVWAVHDAWRSSSLRLPRSR